MRVQSSHLPEHTAWTSFDKLLMIPRRSTRILWSAALENLDRTRYRQLHGSSKELYTIDYSSSNFRLVYILENVKRLRWPKSVALSC
jgi:hypothetical protein